MIISVSEASREVVANLAERKNLYTLVFGVKECVCLSVTFMVGCLGVVQLTLQLGGLMAGYP